LHFSHISDISDSMQTRRRNKQEKLKVLGSRRVQDVLRLCTGCVTRETWHGYCLDRSGPSPTSQYTDDMSKMVCVQRERAAREPESPREVHRPTRFPHVRADTRRGVPLSVRSSNGRNESSKSLHMGGTSRDAFCGMNY